MKQPAIFIDRDGTLIEEVNFLSRVEDLSVFPFTGNALKRFKDNGFLILVVTNQSGISRGHYTEEAMHAIHDQIQSELGGLIDAFYHCPHLPTDECNCRKPGLGMIRKAMADFEIDLSGSWIVGDKDLDIETGRAADIRTALVLTGYGLQHQAALEPQPDIVAPDLGAAADAIIGLNSSEIVI